MAKDFFEGRLRRRGAGDGITDLTLSGIKPSTINERPIDLDGRNVEGNINPKVDIDAKPLKIRNGR